MTMPANIRVATSVPFPSMVKGGGLITVSKANGIWTIGFSVLGLAGLPAGSDPTTIQLFVWNTNTNTFQVATIAQLLSLAANSPTLITIANSPYVPKVTDSIIYVDTAGGAVEIDLAAANTRSGAPLTIKDLTGHAAANNITIKPNGLETVDGYTNGNPLKINANYGGFRLNPYTAVNPNAYVIAP
jgi:hypothetical protein